MRAEFLDDCQNVIITIRLNQTGAKRLYVLDALEIVAVVTAHLNESHFQSLPLNRKIEVLPKTAMRSSMVGSGSSSPVAK